MLKDITLGQYFPGSSIVHRLDPRLKIILIAALIVMLFVTNTAIAYCLLAAFILLTIRLSKLSLRMILRGLKPIVVIIVLTGVLNLFYTPGLEILRLFGVLSITQEGVRTAIIMVVRLILLIAGTSILTYTTSPIALTDALERLFSPLKVIHVPVHEVAMMMSIALRFIPILLEETDKIMKAQMSRGADFESGNLMHRLHNMIPLLVPLFISATRRANELAYAMDARCYNGGAGRTKMKPLKYNPRDYKGYAVLVLYVIVLILVTRTVAI